MKNKDGFISMTVMYSFLIIFVLVLLNLLLLYAQKAKMVDSIVDEAKKDIYSQYN